MCASLLLPQCRSCATLKTKTSYLFRTATLENGLLIRCRRRTSSCFREAARPMCACRSVMWRKQGKLIRMRFFLYTRSVFRKYRKKRISVDQLPVSWITPEKAMRRNLLSERRTALFSICSMSARIRNSIRCPRTVSVTI